MHFRQKTPESQVEGFEDADVGSQVVSQSHGCRGMWHSAMLEVAAVVVVEERRSSLGGCGEVRPELIRAWAGLVT